MQIALSGTNRSAFTRVDLIVVVVLTALLFLVALEQITTCKGKSPRVKCTATLKLAALAFALWLHDNDTELGSLADRARLHELLGTSKQHVDNRQMLHTFLAISNHLYTPGVLVCPGDKKRKPVDSFQKLTTRNMSYFLAVDPNATNVSQVLLGDRDLALNKKQAVPGILRVSDPLAVSWAGVIHGKDAGNVALIDGSAHQITTKGLRDHLPQTGFAGNNRFLIP